ncbi:MAG: zf-HC2 domain-containing protein [Ruminococcus sp.]|nr:zf-HC2 domain-containing protein [Ruminococcus sp.]
MDCRIIQDLLPLYAEKLTSEESAKAVEEHLRGCPECMEKLGAITADTAPAPLPDRDIKPLKKARRSLLFRIPTIILSSALLLGAAFLFLFWGVIPISSARLGTVIEVTGSADSARAKEYSEIDPTRAKRCLSFTFIGSCPCIRDGYSVHYDYNPDGTMTDHYDITIYPELKLPFGNRGEHPNEFTFTTSPKKGETLTVHCSDRVLVYDLWELYQQYAGEDE